MSIMGKSNRYLFWLALSFFIAGLIEGWLTYAPNVADIFTLLHMVISALLILAWCKTHSAENELHPSGAFLLFVALIPPVGVPTYFFKFFEFRSGAKKVLKSLGFSVVLIAAYSLGYALIGNVERI